VEFASHDLRIGRRGKGVAQQVTGLVVRTGVVGTDQSGEGGVSRYADGIGGLFAFGGEPDRTGRASPRGARVRNSTAARHHRHVDRLLARLLSHALAYRLASQSLAA